VTADEPCRRTIRRHVIRNGYVVAHGHESAPSRRRTIVFSTFTRAKSLSSASTSVHGASSVDVRSTMSATACSYASHFARLRQSSGVILKRLNGVFSRALKRRYCSALLTCSQNLHSTTPSSTSCSSNWLISSYARRQSKAEQYPSTRSTSTRPYQVRSKIVMPPRMGTFLQKRHRYGYSS